MRPNHAMQLTAPRVTLAAVLRAILFRMLIACPPIRGQSSQRAALRCS